MLGGSSTAVNIERGQAKKDSGVPAEAMVYSDFIKGGTWAGVDEVLRDVYKEASEVLGQEFTYPGD